jgi:tRNA(Ile)-lysidine synthase TilS/MesJ
MQGVSLTSFCAFPYVKDPTNDDTHYLRNAIRHVIIPACKQVDPRFTTTFRHTLELVQDTDTYLAAVVDRVLSKIILHTSEKNLLHVEKFLKIDTFLHPRILVAWLASEHVVFTPSTSFFNELIRFLKNPAIKHQVHPSWSLVKKDKYVSIEQMS